MDVPQRLDRYRLLRELGRGGMGVVYAAHDERLDRPVALKMIRGDALDETARKRLWREARVAAGFSHPNICQIYEIGEEQNCLFIAMELLEGEPLSQRIRRGALPLPEAIQIALSILSALETLHRRSLAHRDLKPSNVFLTIHGVKLLDFGLTRAVNQAESIDGETLTEVTLPGMLVGTPHYMAPEQLRGDSTGLAADLFATGSILYELLTGRRAFSGSNVASIYHAVVYEQPPALGGSPMVVAADRVLRKALAKQPEDRYHSAQEMAGELRAVLSMEESGSGTAPVIRSITRLIVLPFRVLRPDPEIDFLSFALADAVTTTLAGLDSLVVRSSLAAAGFDGGNSDLRKIAAEAQVDVVLTGTLLRAGDQIRMSVQLVEAPEGTLVWSRTDQAALSDIFQLQDELVQRIVDSLSLRLSSREHQMLHHDVPQSPTAYQLYLRANQLSLDQHQMQEARRLYEESVNQDPSYAPAWARLGRCYRVLGKYAPDAGQSFERAERAFEKALQLNPDLALAHGMYAQLEADLGRAAEAMVRLLERLRVSRNAPDLFAGLVYVFRFVGLLEESIAAHYQARRLDPQIPTSVTQSHFLAGECQRCIDTCAGDFGYIDVAALATMGFPDKALRLLRQREAAPGLAHLFLTSLRALLQGNRRQGVQLTEDALQRHRPGPEELYHLARHFAFGGAPARALDCLEQSVAGGFRCFPAFASDPWLDSLRADPRFHSLLRQTQEYRRQADTRLEEAGGRRLLAMQ